MLSKGEILTLDNNKEYVVVASRVMDNINYTFLINDQDYSDFMFCEYKNDNLKEIVDDELVNKLLELFKEDYQV